MSELSNLVLHMQNSKNMLTTLILIYIFSSELNQNCLASGKINVYKLIHGWEMLYKALTAVIQMMNNIR